LQQNLVFHQAVGRIVFAVAADQRLAGPDVDSGADHH
jgi:hypothetical protein